MSTLERGILVAACMMSSFAQAQTYNLGRAPTAREIAGWNIDVTPDGVGLPPGSGTVKQGGEVFVSQCSGCHGAKGEGGVEPGGRHRLAHVGQGLEDRWQLLALRDDALR